MPNDDERPTLAFAFAKILGSGDNFGFRRKQGWAFHELFGFFGIRIILYIIRQDGSNTEYLLGNLFYVE